MLRHAVSCARYPAIKIASPSECGGRLAEYASNPDSLPSLYTISV